MDYSVQRVDSAPIQRPGRSRKDPGQSSREFEQEMDQAKPEDPTPIVLYEDTPVAPRLDDEAGGKLDLTA